MVKSVEEILWQSIKDIESGDVAFISEDPMNGYLEGRNKKLNKMNVSQQSAKYTEHGKPISRPTIDKYKSIVDYINNKKEASNKQGESLIEENKRLKEKIKELTETIQQTKEYADGIAFEYENARQRLKQYE